jgi:hypothetical protein
MRPWCGGLRILECIEAVNYDVFRRRPEAGETRLADHILARPAHVAQKPARQDGKNGFSPVAHSVRR